MNILNLKKDITQILKIIILTLILSAGVNFIYAQTSWFPPGVGPNYQTNQIDPLTEGFMGMQKDSGLTLYGWPLGLLVTNNNVGIGPFLSKSVDDYGGDFSDWLQNETPQARLHIKAGIEECSGTPNSCNVYDGDGLACEAAGCTVSLVYGYPNCIGTPTSCPDLSEVVCAPSGCLWTAGGIEATQIQGGLLVVGEPGVAMDNDEITVQTTVGSPLPPLYIQNNGGNTIFNLAADNVGLGVALPLNKLHVKRTIYAANWIGAGCESNCSDFASGYAIIYSNGKIRSTELAHGILGVQKRICTDANGFLLLCEKKYYLGITLPLITSSDDCDIPIDVEYAIFKLWGGGGGGMGGADGRGGTNPDGGAGGAGGGSGGYVMKRIATNEYTGSEIVDIRLDGIDYPYIDTNTLYSLYCDVGQGGDGGDGKEAAYGSNFSDDPAKDGGGTAVKLSGTPITSALGGLGSSNRWAESAVSAGSQGGNGGATGGESGHGGGGGGGGATTRFGIDAALDGQSGEAGDDGGRGGGGGDSTNPFWKGAKGGQGGDQGSSGGDSFVAGEGCGWGGGGGGGGGGNNDGGDGSDGEHGCIRITY